MAEQKWKKIAKEILNYFKLYYKAIVLKTAWYFHNQRTHIDQKNRTEFLNITLHRHRFLVFDK